MRFTTAFQREGLPLTHLLVIVLLLQSARLLVESKIPDAEVVLQINIETVTSNDDSSSMTLFHAAYGDFGSREAVSNLRLHLYDDPDKLCLYNNSGIINPSDALPFYNRSDLLLVPRGDCSFAKKSYTAYSMGAAGVVIYNTLESRYGSDENHTSVRYPVDETDYECEYGEVFLEDAPFTLDPPLYNGTLLDPYMTHGTSLSLCNLPIDKCESQRCLLTQKLKPNNKLDFGKNNSFLACCAWDKWVAMSNDNEFSWNETTIQDDVIALFITMAQAAILFPFYSSTNESAVTNTILVASIQPRWFPIINPSSFFLWILGTFICGFASWFSAQEYRHTNQLLTARRQRLNNRRNQLQERPVAVVEMTTTNNGAAPPANTTTSDDTTTTISALDASPNEPLPPMVDSTSSPTDTLAHESLPPIVDLNPQQTPEEDPTNHDSLLMESSQQTAIRHDVNLPVEQPIQTSSVQPSESPPSPTTNGETTPAAPQQEESSPQPPSQSQQRPRRFHTRNFAPQSSMTLTMWHAAAFVVIASLLLILLFFFEFYTSVTVFYGVGCSGAMAQVIFRPLYILIWNQCIALTRNNNHNDAGACCCTPSTLLCPKLRMCAQLTVVDVLASLSGYAIGALWLYIWFTADEPSTNIFYWVTQNVMGACICILFLSMMRLQSIKVATVLLLAVFAYDIFFVFITPFLFDGDSVMVTVATGGGPSDTVSSEYCEKYPSDPECRRGQPLPMLLQIPKVFDYRMGSVLLGLGDIVLPGLLISFGARVDDAKRLLREHTTILQHEQVLSARRRRPYFVYLIIAYAVGLLLANFAVVWMNRGQPALLYLVPTTLGTMLFIGWHELQSLWDGPLVLLYADRLVRWTEAPHGTPAAAVFLRDDATVAESMEEEEGDDDLHLWEEGDHEVDAEGRATGDGNHTHVRVVRMGEISNGSMREVI